MRSLGGARQGCYTHAVGILDAMTPIILVRLGRGVNGKGDRCCHGSISVSFHCSSYLLQYACPVGRARYRFDGWTIQATNSCSRQDGQQRGGRSRWDRCVSATPNVCCGSVGRGVRFKRHAILDALDNRTAKVLASSAGALWAAPPRRSSNETTISKRVK